jgi:hypothetical protein
MKRFCIVLATFIAVTFVAAGAIITYVYAVSPAAEEPTSTPAEVVKVVKLQPSQNTAEEYTTVSVPEVDSQKVISEEAIALAKTVWGEARGCSKAEQAAVAWCILNRVDSELPYMPDDIIGVVTQKDQFAGYSEDFPVEEEQLELALDVLGRWEAEKCGETEVGRVLPKEYLYFHGDGTSNHFRTDYEGGTIWNWNLENPYD